MNLVWLVPLLPLAGFLLNGTLALAKSRTKGIVSFIGVGTLLAAFGVAVYVVLDLARTHPEGPVVFRYWDWIPVGGDAARRHGRRLADSHLQRRLHARRRRVRALLRLPQPVRLLHADARFGSELPGDVRGVGRGRALLVPAHRVLVRGQGERGRREEGVHHEPHRRLRLSRRDVPDLAAHRVARLHDGVRAGAHGAGDGRRRRYGD